MMYIEEILSINNSASEADVYVSDGVNRVLAFASFYEGNLRNGAEVKEINAFMLIELEVLDHAASPSVKKTHGGYYAQELIGVVDDSGKALLVGGIRISIEESLPVGAWVRSRWMRLDL